MQLVAFSHLYLHVIVPDSPSVALISFYVLFISIFINFLKELQEVLSRGKTDNADADRIQGVGHKK